MSDFDTATSSARRRTGLPPGQRALEGFPRFGTHLDRPPPEVPADPVISISGAGITPISLPVANLTELPRRELTADFHCVSGWSATGLTWGGVGFAELYDSVIAPALPAGTVVTHVLFGGLDGFESLAELEDVLAPHVTIADHLGGRPLGPDHGAPVRLVSPDQYGYVSCKHLCRIELHTSRPTRELGAATPEARKALRGPFVMRHPRARVWEEERHPYLPARLLRPFYRRVIRRGITLAARGLRSEPERPGDA